MGKPMPQTAGKQEQQRTLNLFYFSMAAIGVGLVGGLGAVVFRGLIALFHNLLFLGQFSFVYNANVHTSASPWGPLVILVPVLGAAGVVFLVKNFAPEAKGHGVPEVMDAIYYSKGIIRPIVAAVKSVASALSIGSGGSIGREGPIIQIGSSFGSTFAQILKISTWQRVTLIAAGTGAGIAATFNTPVGGVLFGMEIMLHEVSVRTMVPVVISTATGTYIGRLFFGATPSFVIPQLEKAYFHATNPWIMISYIGLGLLMGLVSAIYIKSVYGFEDFFDKHVKGGYYVRHLSGMLLVGVIMYTLWRVFGHYYIEGVGYATVQDILSGRLYNLPFLLLLFFLKLLSTSLTLGSGASGGIFSPGLFMGATLGGAYGMVVGWIFPGLEISPAAFAVAGMAGVIGGSTGAAMASIVMIFEMTLDYTVIIPMTITVALSHGIRQILSPESIYTLKLARRGHTLPNNFLSDFHLVRYVSDIMSRDIHLVSASTGVGDYARSMPDNMRNRDAVIEDSGSIIGTLGKARLLKNLTHQEAGLTVGEIVEKDFIKVLPDTKVFEVIKLLYSEGATNALVVTDLQSDSIDSLIGIVDKASIVDNMEDSLALTYD
ncbi:MAG: chloride channel protein [Desulfosarcinaceae bacterium]